MTRRALIRKIGSAAFCDNGTMIDCRNIGDALDADRGAGFQDPTWNEVRLLVQGGDSDGQPPPELSAAHPALYALLIREMT